MKNGYYECERCPRWFKVVEGVEIEVNYREALRYNVELIKKKDCKVCMGKKSNARKNYDYSHKKVVQDYGRYKSFI
jgi:hypothetical protein